MMSCNRYQTARSFVIFKDINRYKYRYIDIVLLYFIVMCIIYFRYRMSASPFSSALIQDPHSHSQIHFFINGHPHWHPLPHNQNGDLADIRKWQECEESLGGARGIVSVCRDTVFASWLRRDSPY